MKKTYVLITMTSTHDSEISPPFDVREIVVDLLEESLASMVEYFEEECGFTPLVKRHSEAEVELVHSSFDERHVERTFYRIAAIKIPYAFPTF